MTTNFPLKGTQPEGAITTGILVALAGAVIDTTFAAAKKAVNPEAATAERRFIQDGLYKAVKDTKKKDQLRVIPAPEMACLVVALAPPAPADAKWNLPFQTGKAGALQAVKNTLQLGAAPLLYLEAVRHFSTDKSAVTWRPVRFHVSEYMNTGFFAGRSRGYQIEARMFAAGSSEAFAAQTFKYESVSKPYDEVGSAADLMFPAEWVTLPAAGDMPTGFAGGPLKPFTLEIRVVESPKPYKLAAMFVDAAETQKAQIKEKVGEAIDDEKRKAAQQTAKASTVTAISTYMTERKKAVDACTTAAVQTTEGKVACSLAIETAAIALQSVETACGVQPVSSCDVIPENVAMP